MPDISKCKNTECSRRESCYRFTVPPDPLLQCYADFEPEIDNPLEFHCKYFWDNGTKNMLRNIHTSALPTDET